MWSVGERESSGNSGLMFHSAAKFFSHPGSPPKPGKKRALIGERILLCPTGGGLLLSLSCRISQRSGSKCSKCNNITHLQNSTPVFCSPHLARLVVLFQQRAVAYCWLWSCWKSSEKCTKILQRASTSAEISRRVHIRFVYYLAVLHHRIKQTLCAQGTEGRELSPAFGHI